MSADDQALRLAGEIARDRAGADVPASALARLEALERATARANVQDFLHEMIMKEFAGRIAVVSSFGAEAAVLLHQVAKVDPSTPVVFLDTGMHFPQTLQYKEEITKFLGLTDVRSIRPEMGPLSAEDPDDTLWQWDTDRCCHIRKVLPLERALDGFDAWINGRKQMHGGARARLPRIEVGGSRVKLNPLATWTRDDVENAFRVHGLPRHPMVAQDYFSIGCWPCTSPGTKTDVRSGRWAGSDKTECGIHLPRRPRVAVGHS